MIMKRNWLKQMVRLHDHDHDHVDVVGVGLGPFNLGLAALLEPIPDINAAFFDSSDHFAWHPGLMLPDTKLQVPFLADLVTMADPTSRYSFLNYLHERGRLYRFYFHEMFHIARREYDAYLRWVSAELPSTHFRSAVTDVSPHGDGWTVTVNHRGSTRTVHANHVVLGVGSRSTVPPVADDVLGDDVFHSADYLTHREKAITAGAVTVIGSGQSAGEVVVDLLETGLHNGMRLDWFTRSKGFLPMEYSKLGLEHFTPEYTDYFHHLPPDGQDRIRAGQDLLYKGLSEATSARIYDLLYDATIDAPDPPVTYAAGTELTAIEPSPTPGRRWRLTFTHAEQRRTFTRDTDVVVLATGYEPAPLPVADGVIATDQLGRPRITADYRAQRRDGEPSTLFVQNAELHTHGVGAPDLGLGAHRNSVIINALAGREVYPVRARTVFQRFGAPA
jgi:lysine N6-hydroxylase